MSSVSERPNTSQADELDFFNRELSWLDFNYRVIDEAYDSDNPFLEQLNFLGIGSSNLDEFFMVRVAGVYDQYHAGIEVAENKTNMSPDDLLDAISERNRRNVDFQYKRYKQLVEQLPTLNYSVKAFTELNENEKEQAVQYFRELILPTLSPLGIDAYRPFPHLKNKVLNIFVNLTKDEEIYQAIVPIPSLLDRYLTFDYHDSYVIVLIEDLIINLLEELFQGYEINYAYPFRITRNADFDIIEEDASDLLILIEDYVKQRRHGAAIRLEIDTRYTPDFNAKYDDFLQEVLEIEDRFVYQFEGPLDLTFLFGLVDTVSELHPEATYAPFKPFLNPKHTGESLYQTAKEHDLFFNHPYDSFDPVVSFIEHAAVDPQTIAIKQTLYRVSKNSPIISALKKAAENGKEVTVLVELKARFDESNNVYWARELEEAGCHVLYGVSDLKTHSKIALVIRMENQQIHRYVHLGTGNYNDKTARTYTDMGIITANPEIGEDASNFFNYLSGYTDRPEYHHLHVSPFAIRDSLIDYIDEEIASHKEHGNGHIIAKMNSLTDKPLIEKLYEASQAGVKIELIVRGICCLKPGVPGLSETIHVRSIVGRFLEHSRIYYFHRNGKRHLFLSSADMMTRNMTKRVEIEFPILDKRIEEQILHILELQLSDNTKARVLQSDGEYTRPAKEPPLINNHISQMEFAGQKKAALVKEHKQASQGKQRPFARFFQALRRKNQK